MATQAVMTAPPEANPDNNPEDAPSPLARGRARVLRVSGGTIALLAISMSLMAIFPKTRSLAWNMAGSMVALAIVDGVKYLREFHPSLLPSVLEYGSPLRIKLAKTKKFLGWTALGTIVLGFAVFLGTDCACEDHPALFIMWLVAAGGAALGFLGVSAYLGLRTVEPTRRSGPSASWPGVRRPISEYKPFHSEHWGEAKDSAGSEVPAN